MDYPAVATDRQRKSIKVTLPKVVATSVVRSTHQGESHGGAYLVELDTGNCQQVLDWNTAGISWEGRGADRGLRGIGFFGGNVLLAASDEVFVYDTDFKQVDSYRHPYLKHCHEIQVEAGSLYLTSTGFDSVLRMDLATGRFEQGWMLRAPGWRGKLYRRGGPMLPRFQEFDPGSDRGPEPGDTTHLNSVWVNDGKVHTSGTGTRHLFQIDGGRVKTHARIPTGTHNARPYRGGVLCNHTRSDAICWFDRSGQLKSASHLPRFETESLQQSDLPADHARQAFGRGLTTWGEDVVIGGSSPATISAYRLGDDEPLRVVNITMDVRNAIHGLEIWPF